MTVRCGDLAWRASGRVGDTKKISEATYPTLRVRWDPRGKGKNREEERGPAQNLSSTKKKKKKLKFNILCPQKKPIFGKQDAWAKQTKVKL